MNAWLITERRSAMDDEGSHGKDQGLCTPKVVVATGGRVMA